MLPGDSLVDKIFGEGIKDAKAVIVVLSNFSVEKPWVREELNAAFVKRINNGSKLIPIVIDDKALEDEGVSPDTPVTLQVPEISFRSALKL